MTRKVRGLVLRVTLTTFFILRASKSLRFKNLILSSLLFTVSKSKFYVSNLYFTEIYAPAGINAIRDRWRSSRSS